MREDVASLLPFEKRKKNRIDMLEKEEDERDGLISFRQGR